jgi:Tol biopolymer transport system component
VRIATIAVLVGALSGGADLAGPAPPQPRLWDFAYSVTVRSFGFRSAICVARDGNALEGRRLAGLGEAAGTSWSPDGSRVAIALNGGLNPAIRVARADGKVFRRLSRPRAQTEIDTLPDWSSDGTTVAFSRYVFFGPGHDYRRFGLWVVDVDSRAEHHFSEELPTSTDWSPSGDRLAVRFSGDLSLFSKGGKRLWTITSPTENSGDLAWSPTGDLLAAVFGGEVRLITPDGTVVRTIARPDGQLQQLETGLSWSSDGRRLAVGGGVIFNRDGSLVGRYAPASTRQAVSFEPRWAPDGSMIVYDRARAVYVSSRYSTYLITGAADLYAFAPATGGTARLTSTPGVNERGVVFRPGRIGGAAGRAMKCMREGTGRRDVIYGTAGPDLVNAGPGNDVVHGRGGGDLIVGGDGNDVLVGGAGRDELWGDRGNDRLFARDGLLDFVHGGAGFDRARADRRDSVTGVERAYRP